jgi:serine/threonine protein kinase
MAIPSGARLGPYEVIGPLGAGGMGEVYRARDERLGREVAIKVLPAEVSADPDRIRRFEKEAQAASSLNHPNIVTIYEVERTDSTSFIVMELVEGKTLRDALVPGPLAIRKLLGIAAQIADGLAKAHNAGIVHRDLKPENVMLTKDGLVKILDFGLAKLAHPEVERGQTEEAPTVSQGTTPGIVMGTVGYMSPEQASGHPVDYRSDQFSFGSVLYEMATGKRAFEGRTKPEILAAIIRDEPQSIGAVNPKVPAPLRWIVERCLAKEPKDRYASSEDLARDLASVRDHLSEISGSGEAFPVGPPRARALGLAVAVLAILAAIAAALFAGKSLSKARAPSFQRLTFSRGHVSGARFSSDGQTIVYSAAWEGKPLEVFQARRESTDSRSLGLPGAHLWSVSSGAEIAFGLGWRVEISPNLGSGTLARVSLGGGEPRQMLERVSGADWSPDGKNLAVVRRGTGGKPALEFPIGRALYESDDGFRGVRVSPKGDLIAFIKNTEDKGMVVAVIDLAGRKRILSSGWYRAQGMAWSPKGDEVWFTAAKEGLVQALWAVSLSGRERLVTRVPGRLTLQDISRDGKVLLTHEVVRREVVGLAPGESQERDLTWKGYSVPLGLSRDGRTLLFFENNESGKPSTLYVRGTDGSPPIGFGEGEEGSSLSSDGRWVLAQRSASGASHFELLPTGAGESRPFRVDGLAIEGADWFPDGSHLLVAGHVPGHEFRDYVVDLTGKNARPLTPEGVAGSRISPDGKWLINGKGSPDGPRTRWIYPVAGGEPRRVPGETPGYPLQWDADGRSVYLGRRDGLDKLDLATGRSEPWREFRPADPTGVIGVLPWLVTPDGKSYVYSYNRVLSDLYLVDGLTGER